MTPEEVILRKNLVSSVRPDGRGISSAEWASFSAAVKDRAFFSANVESVRFLDTARTRIADLLSAAKNSDGALVSRAQVVSDIMQAARDSGIARGTNLISDPGSAARANVIIDTNAGLAAGYAKAEISNSYGARLAFPAQELIRIEERLKPRDWRSTWVKKGGKLFAGRMIALKEDPIWLEISRFGVPYPPFDFNSGMGLEDVSYDEAVSLGLIKDDYQPPQASPIDNFNKSLEAEMSVPGPDSDLEKMLKDSFGEQIQYNPHAKRVYFSGAFVQDIAKKVKAEFDAGKKTTSIKAKPSLGRPSERFCIAASLPHDTKYTLNLPPANIMHVIKDHVEVDKDPNNNIPLDMRELDIIPHVWRKPDSIEPGDKENHWILSSRSADGNIYRLVVSLEDDGGFSFHTFYKKKGKK